MPNSRALLARDRAMTTLLVTTSILASSVSAAFVGDDADPSALSAVWAYLGWWYGVGVATFLVFRGRYPVAVTVMSCVGAIVYPLDVFAALVGLAWVIASRPRRTAWWTGALVAVATVVSFGRDLQRDGQRIFSTSNDDGSWDRMPAWGYVLMALFCLLVPVCVGIAARARRETLVAEEQSRAHGNAADRLRAHVARQEEREELARELHDAMAHQLSLVSLHAGALEVAAPADRPELGRAAQVVRESAHASLEDLRDIVSLLRDPDEGGGRVGLADLPALVARTRESGVELFASVLLDDAGSVAPRTGRAVYRIVQEALTNARKHAPGRRVTVDVRGRPADGVSVRVTNDLPPAGTPALAPGSGSGVDGLTARAVQAGGRARAGVEGREFVVDAWLPWASPTA